MHCWCITLLQVYDELVLPGNPAADYGISGLFNNSDFLLVNGAWQPVIQMKVGSVSISMQCMLAAFAKGMRFCALALVAQCGW